MKRFFLVVAIVGCAVSVFAAFPARQKTSFAGTWTLDQSRSYNLPRTMKQTMTIVQDGDKLAVETEIETEQGKRTVKDDYVLDEKEAEFTPQTLNDPNAKGKRKARWVPGGKSFVVDEVIATKNPEGAAITLTITRKWLIWPDGSLSIDIYQDSPRGSSESRRFFTKKS